MSRRDRPLIERMIAGAAWAMVGFALVAGVLAGLALLGVSSFGPALGDWATGKGPAASLLLAFVVWPLLGALYVALGALFEGAWASRGKQASSASNSEGGKQ